MYSPPATAFTPTTIRQARALQQATPRAWGRSRESRTARLEPIAAMAVGRGEGERLACMDGHGGGAAAAIQGLAPNTPKGKWRRGLPSTPPAGRGMWASRAKHSAHKSRNPAQTRAAGAGGVGAQRCNRTARASTHTHTTTTTPRPQHQQHQQQTRTNNNKQQHTTTNNNKKQQHTTTRNNQAQDETKGSPDTLADSPADLVSPRVVRGM